MSHIKLKQSKLRAVYRQGQNLPVVIRSATIGATTTVEPSPMHEELPAVEGYSSSTSNQVQELRRLGRPCQQKCQMYLNGRVNCTKPRRKTDRRLIVRKRYDQKNVTNASRRNKKVNVVQIARYPKIYSVALEHKVLGSRVPDTVRQGLPVNLVIDEFGGSVQLRCASSLVAVFLCPQRHEVVRRWQIHRIRRELYLLCLFTSDWPSWRRETVAIMTSGLLNGLFASSHMDLD
ncbi:hypothetical protein DFH06DRAFT_1131538 [Mycena polygramma]|nr:hypothetical protein DFH06DRAFT_1131538 [Mycena polygramma]